MRLFRTMAQLRRFWSAYVDALERRLNRTDPPRPVKRTPGRK